MTNNDELAYLKQLATYMTERFSMNPVSSKILNEDWKKRFPDDVAVAETLVSLLAERDADKKRIAELEESHKKLRETMAAIHNTIRADGAYTPLAAIMSGVKRAYEDSAAVAGIKLEVGE